MNFLTDFADQAVVLPFALVVAVALGVAGWWRGMFAWILAVGGVLGTILTLKLVCIACAIHFNPIGVVSPSGHTAGACIAYGGLLVLLMHGRLPRLVVALLPVGIGVLIGISRLALHAHTLGDVMVAMVVGMAGVAVLALLAGPRPALRPWPVGMAVLVVLAVFHGLRMPAEAAIHHAALADLLPLLPACRA